MKGFPNQVADLEKLAAGMQCVVSLLEAHGDVKDDGVLGPALVRAGVAGTGHVPAPIEEYIRTQLKKPRSGQSFRTTARGLRELYRLLGFIDDSGPELMVTDLGRQAASFAGAPIDDEQRRFWRRVIRNLRHYGGDDKASHPYQVLLRLIGRQPNLSRAMCALALEAKDDSPEELERIVALAGLPEPDVHARIGITKSNWDNAKKILPKFAEQLGDVTKSGSTFRLADAPGQAGVPLDEPQGMPSRAPRTSREVSGETIARAGMEESFDEVEIPPAADPEVAAEAIRSRRERLRRHNTLVRVLAEALCAEGQLFEDPFDLLKIIDTVGILVEVKTLDGSAADERTRVREALAQLLYYEAFVAAPLVDRSAVRKVACFEQAISPAHQAWLNEVGIGVIWREGERFRGDTLAVEFLGDYIDELN